LVSILSQPQSLQIPNNQHGKNMPKYLRLASLSNRKLGKPANRIFIGPTNSSAGEKFARKSPISNIDRRYYRIKSY
jgi:hypothetical protein